MKLKIILLVFCVASVFSAIGLGAYRAYTTKKPVRFLPYYGLTRYDSLDDKFKKHIVSRPHSVPDFSFVNQENKIFDRMQMKGNIYVVDFFFSTCNGICPNMSKNISVLYTHFAASPEVRFLSYTVDPEHDTPTVLAEYAARYDAKPPKWNFLTGDKKQIYTLARQGYQLADPIDITIKEDFIHTQNFALIDKTGFIRGYYQGTDARDMQRLKVDIELLLADYAYKKE